MTKEQQSVLDYNAQQVGAWVGACVHILYMHTYIYIILYTYIYIYIYIFIYVHTSYICVCVCVFMLLLLHIQDTAENHALATADDVERVLSSVNIPSPHTNTHLYTPPHRPAVEPDQVQHTHTHTIYTCSCTHTHTNTHTHTCIHT
jgi:hypothetical protein